MPNFKLSIEYDGTHFYGWQRQRDQITIQGEIEKALSLILNQNIKIIGSGRTDAGVHALGQVANFQGETSMTPYELQKRLNSVIKHPIVIRECRLVDNDFHAQYSAKSKEYHYHILNREVPCSIGAAFVWHIRQHLDIEKMRLGCEILLGVHDFKSFQNTGSPRSSTIREIYLAMIEIFPEQKLVIKIRAGGFLKNMVRNIVGTLVAVGKNKISPEDFRQILESRDRTLAGVTAPANGLILHSVYY